MRNLLPSHSRPTAFEEEFEVSFEKNQTAIKDPRVLSNFRKWMIVAIVSSTSTCVACASSIFASTSGQIMVRFSISDTVATLGLTLFAVGLALSPMILAPLSELFGRRPIYFGSMISFILFTVPCSVAQNIQTLMVARFFEGFAGAAFLSVAGGTVGDLFTHHELGPPMLLYTLSPFLGPQLGPLIGGFINSYTDWRWTYYVLMIWGGTQFLAILFFVPETYRPVVLRKEARHLRLVKQDTRYWAPLEKSHHSIPKAIIISTYRPFILLTMEPMCLLLCLYCAVLLGIVYLFFEAFAIVFTSAYGFELWQVGLAFLGMLIGTLLTAISQPIFKINYARLMSRHHAEFGPEAHPEPEFSLVSAIVGAPLITTGLIWFAWTCFTEIHWIVPIIATSFFGAGLIFVFSGVFAFLVAAYPTFAASALAANSFARGMMAAGFPLFARPLYHNLGNHWAGFLLAMLTAVMGPLPWIFFRYGRRIRAKSRYSGAR